MTSGSLTGVARERCAPLVQGEDIRLGLGTRQHLAGLGHVCQLCGSLGGERHLFPTQPSSSALCNERIDLDGDLVRNLLAEGREAEMALGSVSPWIGAVGHK